ncbi:MAG: DUF2817 domain-containing protein [Deltaproteobacteria bacterium]|nr:DUF2817 domain-containing protein [Deltaproteobacteria bacterium]
MTLLDTIELLAAAWPSDILARIDGLPIRAFRFGVADRRAPVLLVTAGVHGLERIGVELAVAYLRSLHARMAWDAPLAKGLESARIIVVPAVNPVGLQRGTRANGRGVDLMRNAPAAATGGTPLVGGHRISSRLPWYMGTAMEPEAAALCRLVEELSEAPLILALDLHSYFGITDRLWYPYARTREPPPDLPAIQALTGLLDAAWPNHAYIIEQTARVYTIRGDLWDYLYDLPRTGKLISLTLEVATLRPRGRERTLRRHLPFIELMFHAAASHAAWLRA